MILKSTSQCGTGLMQKEILMRIKSWCKFKTWGQSWCKRRSLGQLPSKLSRQCLASWASSSRLCHHRASFRILAFYQNRFFLVPNDHIVDKIASKMKVASLQKQLLLLTLLKRRGSVTSAFKILALPQLLDWKIFWSTLPQLPKMKLR